MTRILILEDNLSDAELAIRELRSAKIDFHARRIETKEEFVESLESFTPDLILADYTLPQFNGLAALRLLKERGLEIPFILCTGASNEETAVECMKEGAVDYILKSSLKRLPSAVVNAIENSKSREAEKRAYAALRESETRLQQAQKMEAIGTLTGGVAHDFNNMLMAILGNTQLALRKLQPEDPVHKRVVEIEKAANKAVELTRKLLAYSRRQHLERRTIDLNNCIAEIMQLLERVIGENVEVVADYVPNLPAVFADPAQVEQVIMNLSINARDAMPDGGEITIETCSIELDQAYCDRFPYVQPGDYVRIRISDSGTGIDSATLPHIFEPFFTTKEQGKGTGLGLSMAYGIVKQHDGHIHVHSEIGEGTTFEIFLPVDPRTVEAQQKKIMDPIPAGTGTILVAEDEEPLRVVARDVLEGLGYSVILAGGGEEAVELFKEFKHEIDLLLFDVVMPRMGGISAYQKILEMDQEVPLVLMTGFSSETVQSRFEKHERSADDLGAVVIQKPYEINELGVKVREAITAGLARRSTKAASRKVVQA